MQRDSDLSGDEPRTKKRRGGDDSASASALDQTLSDAEMARPLPPSITPATYWQAMTPFFAPLTQDHINRYLAGPALRPNDSAFAIPPLGLHSRHAQMLNDARDRNQRAGMTPEQAAAEAAAVEYWATDACQPGELTQRLLAALLDEESALNGAQAASVSRRATLAAQQSHSNDKASELAPAHPLAVPPVANYAPANAIALDARVRDSLRSVGLLDMTPDLPLHLREDDELCAELRGLQRGLRERAKVNAARKGQIARLVLPRVQEQRKRLKQQHDDAVMESRLVSQLKLSSKKGKRKKGNKK